MQINPRWHLLVYIFSSLLLLAPLQDVFGQYDLPLVEAQEQFMLGNFCETLTIIDRGTRLGSDSLSTELHLLAAEASLALERWEDVRIQLKILDQLENQSQALQKWKTALLRARLMEKQALFEQAGVAYQQLIASISAIPGQDHPLYAHTLAYYGLFLLYTEAFDDAEKQLLEATEKLAVNDLMLARCYNGLANLYQYRSQNVFAVEAFQNARQIWERQGLTQHPDYALLLNDYSLLYFNQNEMEAGEELLTLSESINQRACFVPSNVAYNAGARATIRLQVSDFEEAASYYREVRSNFLDLGQHKEVAIACNALGRIYFELDTLLLSQQYFEEAFKYISRAFGADKPGLIKALILDGIATNYYFAEYEDETEEENALQAADSLYLAEQAMLEIITGKQNMHYSNVLNNRAFFYEYLGRNEEVGRLYKESLSIVNQIYGSRHPDYLTTLYNLARFYSAIDSTQAAVTYYQQANQLQLELLENYFDSFDEQVRMNYRLEALGNFDVFFNYAGSTQLKGLSTEMQNLNLATKNLVLDYAIQTRQLQNSAGTAAIEKIRKQWTTTRRFLSEAYNMRSEERARYGLSVDSLDREADRLERSLVRQLPQRFGSIQRFTFEDLKNQLSSKEASIDFLTYSYHDGYDFYADSLLYFALITRPGYPAPKLVYLTNGDSLEQIFSNYSNYAQNLSASYQLYRLIWQPLEPFLQGVKKIHLSPDGLLFKISFGGLFTDPEDDKSTLLDRYQLFYYSNLRDFLLKENSPKLKQSALIIGDPAFDADPGLQVQQTSGEPLPIPVPESKDTKAQSYFSSLRGTANEIHTVVQHLARKGFSVAQYQQEKAMEGALKQFFAQTSPGIIHLSTHGYFLPFDESADTLSDQLSERLQSSQNALLRSGLALAGANYAWTGGKVAYGAEDGLLNAQEVTDLNLSQTGLVVLSACETGLGKITDGEGVFGLQRAFKISGANQLLMSLWNVSDYHTAFLMDHFYHYLLRGKSPSQALRKAQLRMKKNYSSPFYWAGFVLVE